MVSAFEVYLVLQLDKLLGVSLLLAVLMGLTTFVLGGLWLMNHADYSGCGEYNRYGTRQPAGEEQRKNHDEYWGRVRTIARRTGMAALLGLSVVTFVPSSSTMAAMIIVPALTSKDVVEPLTAEAKDLYALAKGALKKVVEADPKTEEVK